MPSSSVTVFSILAAYHCYDAILLFPRSRRFPRVESSGKVLSFAQGRINHTSTQNTQKKKSKTGQQPPICCCTHVHGRKPAFLLLHKSCHQAFPPIPCGSSLTSSPVRLNPLRAYKYSGTSDSGSAFFCFLSVSSCSLCSCRRRHYTKPQPK